MTSILSTARQDLDSITYPDSDGKPMADNTKQFRWIVIIKDNLELLFADQEDVFVAGDLLWYPVEGNNKLRQAPDALVVFGRPKGDRGSYQQWKEDNIPPQVVFEILSPGNRLGEMSRKLEFYDRYGVDEYYLYDPDKVDVAGWVRENGRLVSIDDMNGWVSPQLNIRFVLGDIELELYQPDGSPFLNFVQLSAQKQAAEQRAEVAEDQVKVAEKRAESAEQRAESAEELLARYRDRFGDLE